jgi:hypothetical protein
MRGTIITKTKTNSIEPADDNNENTTTNTTNNYDIVLKKNRRGYSRIISLLFKGSF